MNGCVVIAPPLSFRYTLIIICILLGGYTTSVFSQPKNKVLKRSYTMDEGLPSNRVYSVVQDSIGFIWMGTNNGLVKFDGKEFRKFRHNSKKPHSISSNDIMSLLQSSDQKIWIALDNGVDIFDPRSHRFRHFDYKTETGDSVKGRTVDILEDKNRDIWIATADDGLFYFSRVKQKLYHYKHDEQDPHSLSQDKLTTLSEDRYGNIWAGTDSQGIVRFSKKTEKFIRYMASDESGSISGNVIQKIFRDSYGNIWIGTLEGGIDRYNEKSDRFENFPPDDENNLLYHIQNIMEYDAGRLLIASDNGVGIYKNEKGKLSYQKEANIELLPETNKYIYALFKDEEGGLWLGSYFNGLEYVPPTQNNFKFFSTETEEGKGDVVNAIVQEKSNKFWIGTDNNGIFQFDAETNTITPFRTAEDIKSSYYNIHDFLLDHGKLWAATYGRGVEIFDLETREITSHLHDPEDSTSIASSRVFSLFKSAEGKIYIGTSHGVDYYNRKEGRFEHLPIKDRVIKMIEDEDNTIWMATRDRGLFRYYPHDRKYVHYQNDPSDEKSLVGDALSSLICDNEGTLWIGSRGYGICRYDKQKDSFVRYPDLELPNEMMASMVSVGDFLWLATHKGLLKWNRHTNNQEVFNTGDGLYNEQFSVEAALISRSGLILLGTADGLCVFSPNKIIKNTFKPSIVATKLFINNDLVQPTDKNLLLKNSIEFTKKLKLKHNQSNIQIDFASLSFTSPSHNVFSYKLEGYDKRWQEADFNNQSLTYTNLPSGEYTLRIKGTNNDGVWSDDEVKLNIQIKPHFLRSTLALTIYGILIIAGVWGLLNYVLRTSERRHEEKIKLLEAETQKIIYDSKIEFFTNMTHEIKTPLSLIMGPLECIAQSSEVQEKYGDYLSIIQLNCKRLFSLVTQLLDFRRVDSGAFKIHDSFINFSTLIKELTTQFKGEAQKNGIEVQVHLKPRNFSVLTDEAALTKILTNLISNALKFAAKEVQIKGIEKENGYIISVENDGRGILEEERDKIFEAFYQTKEGEGRGIGVGLNMTKTLVTLLGGNIQVSERPFSRSGIKFTFQLPKKKDDKEILLKKLEYEEEKEEFEEDSEELKVEGQAIKTVLLVDDNKEILEFLTRILENDYTLNTAINGEQALVNLKENQIDLVISDIMMEGMDGLELCRKIKENLGISHVPIVLLTAKTDLDVKLEGLDMGIDAFLEKPFSPMQLKAQIKNLFVKREELKKEFASSSSSIAKAPTHNKLDEDFIVRCNTIIEEKMGLSNFSVDLLAKELGMSRTLLYRKIRAITGLTPNNLIKMIRLKKAGQLLKERRYSITEIGYLVGFNSPSYFTKCFSEYFDMTPSEYVKE